jgi:hypothetical protein
VRQQLLRFAFNQDVAVAVVQCSVVVHNDIVQRSIKSQTFSPFR